MSNLVTIKIKKLLVSEKKYGIIKAFFIGYQFLKMKISRFVTANNFFKRDFLVKFQFSTNYSFNRAYSPMH